MARKKKEEAKKAGNGNPKTNGGGLDAKKLLETLGPDGFKDLVGKSKRVDLDRYVHGLTGKTPHKTVPDDAVREGLSRFADGDKNWSGPKPLAKSPEVAPSEAKKGGAAHPPREKKKAPENGGEPTWREAVAKALSLEGGKKVGTQAIWKRLRKLIPGKIEKLEAGKNPSNAYRSMIMNLMKHHTRVSPGVWTAKE